MPFFQHLDNNSDITDITFNDRKRLGPLDKAAQRIMRGHSPLSTAEKEIMAAFVSGLNACQFCYGSHAEVAAQFGVDADIIEQLIEDIDEAPVSDQLKPLFHYLKKLTLSPSKIVQKDVDNVLAAGWTEEALYHAILIGCLFNFYNRLLDGHGVKGDTYIYQIGGAHLGKNGYGVPWFIRFIKSFIRRNKLKKLQALRQNVA